MALFHSFGAAGYTTTFISIDVFARTFPLINVAIADRAKEPARPRTSDAPPLPADRVDAGATITR
jgi:hypothetical protein